MISALDLGWAAGFLEGEGCFHWHTTPTITAGQVDLDPLERLQNLFGGKIHVRRRAGKGLSKQDLFDWRVTGARAAGIMMTVFMLVSVRKRARIQKALRPWRAKGQCRNWKVGVQC